METWHIVVGVVGVILGPSGAAWTAVKLSLNGLKSDVRRIEGNVEKIGAACQDNTRNIAVLRDRHDRPA